MENGDEIWTWVRSPPQSAGMSMWDAGQSRHAVSAHLSLEDIMMFMYAQFGSRRAVVPSELFQVSCHCMRWCEVWVG